MDAHTTRYFDFRARRAPFIGFWLPGTTRDDVQRYLLLAVQKLKAKHFAPRRGGPVGDDRPAGHPASPISDGIRVQIGVTNRYIGQFFPLQDTKGLGRIPQFALDEIRMIGRALFGRR